MASHVLLAACRPDEAALEDPDAKDASGSLFTTALIEYWRRSSLHDASYTRLFETLNLKNGIQHPQCEGVNKDRLLFSVNTLRAAQQLMSLCPGLSDIREKLRLASTRSTTRVEDAAYSLLGIFEAAGISAIYGEGEVSPGRLLANLTTRSRDVNVLAWTGDCSRFNSWLPARISVFNGPTTTPIPSPIPDTEMEVLITTLHPPFFGLDVTLRLYGRLNDLSTPQFAESQMTLSCTAFRLPAFAAHRHSYRVCTAPFGTLEIRTRHNLSRWKSLYLTHLWLDALLDHEDVEDDGMPLPSPYPDDDKVSDNESDGGDGDDERETDSEDGGASLLPEPESPLHAVPAHMAPVDRETGARRLAVRL